MEGYLILPCQQAMFKTISSKQDEHTVTTRFKCDLINYTFNCSTPIHQMLSNSPNNHLNKMKMDIENYVCRQQCEYYKKYQEELENGRKSTAMGESAGCTHNDRIQRQSDISHER